MSPPQFVEFDFVFGFDSHSNLDVHLLLKWVVATIDASAHFGKMSGGEKNK